MVEEEEGGEEEEGENEEEEEEQERKRKQEQLSEAVSRASSNAFLLSDPQDISEGLVNPAFSQGNSHPSSRSRSSSQWVRPVKSPRWAYLSRDRPYGYCRSLSSSVENMTFSGTTLSPTRGSFPSLNEMISKECCVRGFKDNTTLQCIKSRGIVYRKHDDCVIVSPRFITDDVCYCICRVVQILRLHSSLGQQRQTSGPEDSEDTREQSRYCTVTENILF